MAQYQRDLFQIDAPRPVASGSVLGESERGAVFTRKEVVNFILDIAGYTADRPLWTFRLLEPSFGHGDFLLPAIDRLLQSYEGHDPGVDLAGAIRGVEIHGASVDETRGRVLAALNRYGIDRATSAQLAQEWLREADFLLAEIEVAGGFTHVVGNPPYVRQEMVAPALMAEYRMRYSTIFDRADLYVPFLERSLDLLAEEGVACMICSDRWMKNRYGAPLRAFVSSRFHLAVYVDMVGVPAFATEVIAYPAITAITRAMGRTTRVAFAPEVDFGRLAAIASALRGETCDPDVSEAREVAVGSEPWLFHAPDRTALVRRLEAEFPTIEEAGCRVGIGVATGADKAFIAPFDEMNVEPERKLRLVTTKDIADGVVKWRGLGVLNPFEDDGSLISLSKYPLTAAWLERNGESVRRRHVAKTRPEAWYRTIDRITASLASAKKLLIPDIKGAAHVVMEEGQFYPHHNLYYVTSDQWELGALKAVLESGIADLFVSAYSVKMAGGHLRFQAQYLRRIRIPKWNLIGQDARTALLSAVSAGDASATRAAVCAIYGLSENERALLLKKDDEDAVGSRRLPDAGRSRR